MQTERVEEVGGVVETGVGSGAGVAEGGAPGAEVAAGVKRGVTKVEPCRVATNSQKQINARLVLSPHMN